MTAPVIPSDPIQDPPADPPAPAPVAPAPPQPGAWREGLSEGLRANPVLERFPDLDGLATEHINLQKHIGTEKVSKPQPNWGDEDYAGLYAALGRPETPEGYDLSGFTPPEGVPWNDEFQGRMVGHLHKAGLNQRQLGEVFASYSQEIAGQAQEADRVANAQAAATEAGLHEKWGKA